MGSLGSGGLDRIYFGIDDIELSLAGLSTSVLQTTGNTLLSSIDSKLGTLGQQTMAGSAPVVVASNQSAIPVTATDLDIRNLLQTQDSVLIYGSDDGGTTKRVIKTDSGGAIQVDLEVASVDITSFPDNEPFNVAQYGGSAVGAGNAFHVQPGTAAVFQVQSNSANLATEATLSTLNGKVTACNTGAVVISSGTITSITQFNGQVISMGTGVRDAGTQRVTIATDDIVPASQSGTWNIGTVTTVTAVTSLTQMNGQSIAMGTGVRTAGTQRVTIATDDVVPASQSGTWNIGTLTTLTGITNDVNVLRKPSATSTYAPTNSSTTAYASNLVVKASAGTLYGFSGYNSKTSSQFILVYDATSLPADGAQAIIVITVSPLSNFSYDAGQFGRAFSTGIVISNSSTAPTKTIGSSDLFIDAQYS